MALSQSALSELLDAFRTGDGVDMIRESVRTVLQELLEFEAAGVIGAQRYERSEDRVTERNGTRPKLLATKAGVNPEAVFNAIKGGLAGSTVMNAKVPMILDGNFKPGFRIELHIKDLQNALDTAHALNVATPLTANVMETMQALKCDDMAACDHSAIVRFYEKLAKVEVRK